MQKMAKQKTNRPHQTVTPSIKPLHILFLLMALVGIYFLLPQLGEFSKTLTAVRHASPFYLLIGVVMSGLTFVAATFTQFAAGNFIGSNYTLTLIQFAGSVLNHFLPFSVGSIGLTAQYYQDLGRRQAEAIAIAILPIIFGVVTTVSIVALISPVTISHLVHNYHDLSHNKWLVGAAVLGLVVGFLALPAFQKKVKSLAKETIHGLKALHNLRQIALLIAGSIAISLTAAIALLVSVKAVHASIALVDVFVLYTTASLVSNVVPTPGGLGATEAVLAVGLASTGVPVPAAVAATLIYRFMTFWLPIPVGVICLRTLNRS